MGVSSISVALLLLRQAGEDRLREGVGPLGGVDECAYAGGGFEVEDEHAVASAPDLRGDLAVHLEGADGISGGGGIAHRRFGPAHAHDRAHADRDAIHLDEAEELLASADALAV